MHRLVLPTVAACILSGCATATVPPPQLTSTFNASDFEWSTAKGNNTINGSALLRTRGGDVKTCAGYDVTLVPANAYSREVVSSPYAANIDPTYSSYIRRTVCDPQGKFTFSSLPTGSYIVSTKVTWEVPQMAGGYSYMSTQGGPMLQEVSVSGGQAQEIVLTR
jgi:hypothetical protein